MVKSNILIGLLVSLAQIACAHAMMLSCPADIHISQRVAGEVPKGWSVLNQSMEHTPEFVEFFATDPHNQGSLAPVKTSLSGNIGYAVWDFSGDGDDLWLACDYNHSTIILYQPLPRNIKTCRVTYAAGGVVTTIDCH